MTTEPTVELPDGVVSRTVDSDGAIAYWDAEGRMHNPDGPAFICPDRATYWLVSGNTPDGIVDAWFGTRVWYCHGRVHRTDGPAVERDDGPVEYRVYGLQITEEQFYQRYPTNQGNPATDDKP